MDYEGKIKMVKKIQKKCLGISIFLVLLLFFVSFVSAGLEQFGDGFPRGSIIHLTQDCSDSTFILINSISYPNSSFAVANITMINQGNGRFVYDFNNTFSSGRYDVRGISDGCSGTFSFYFDVTDAIQSKISFDFTKPLNLVLLVLVFLFCLLLLYLRQFMWLSFILVIIGLVMFFSGISFIFCLIPFLVGLIIAFGGRS